MISYKTAKRTNRFCLCEECLELYSEEDENGFWEVCARCNLPVEGSYVYDGTDYLQGIMSSDE